MGKAVKKKTEGDFVKVHPEAKRQLLRETWQSDNAQANLHVFEYLCTKIDYEGVAEFTVEEITAFYGMSRISVDRALSFLKTHGYIEVLKFGTKIRGVRFLERTAESVVAHLRTVAESVCENGNILDYGKSETQESEAEPATEKEPEPAELSPATLPVEGFVVSKGCGRPKPPAADKPILVHNRRRGERRGRMTLPPPAAAVTQKPQPTPGLWTYNPVTGRPEINGRSLG